MNTAEAAVNEDLQQNNNNQNQQRSASSSLPNSDAPAEGMQVDDATRAQVMLVAAKIINGIDITEIFSPVRVVAMAEKMGLIGGLSMDLRTGWDFTKAEDRERCRQYVRRARPLVLIGSPPCTMFSRLQNLNWGKSEERDARMHKELKTTKEHIDFCCEMYELQMKAGRYFVHEHPDSASSWALDRVCELTIKRTVITVHTDMCEFGLSTKDAMGEQPSSSPIQ